MQQHKEVSKIITYRAYLPLRNISLGKTGAAFSGLALSTLAIWCRVVRFRDVQFRVFSAPAETCGAVLLAQHRTVTKVRK